ncbi:MAG: tRNA glutamyl-Q(34) synthetase GluQRS [Acidobacteria bacterium]|nr:tRNA glutamyl-Q(34) synthetase GluQRS [Acidobacteriota bacterium]
MYRGRFAPSPTGPLHLGSLVAAAASWLDARAHGGEWLVRMEDVDEPRSKPVWADSILKTLERFGLEWNGTVLVQSERKEAYQAALRSLKARNMAYGCGCSRKEAGEGRYPGTCRSGCAQARAWRFLTEDGVVSFDDRWTGRFGQDVATEVGDFVVLRADGYFAYQLAVVVDDGDQGVTDVVRGADLLDSTPRQILLQRALGLPTPKYLHHPLVKGKDGDKLSKQTQAQPVDEMQEDAALAAALGFLGLDSRRLEAAIEEWREKWVNGR